MVEVFHITTDQAQQIYNLGKTLVEDDKNDLGYLKYYNRPHEYHGEIHRDHPSMWHHWIPGIFIMTIGQVLGVYAQFREIQESVQNGQIEQS